MTSSSLNEPAYEGAIFGVFGNIVLGGMWNQRGSDEPLIVELLIDSQVAVEVLANHAGADLERLGLPKGRACGFRIPLREAWCDDQRHTMQIRAKGSQKLFPWLAKRVRLAASVSPFMGGLDDAEKGVIRGWAWDRRLGEQPAAIELLVDGTVVAQVSANQFRADLKMTGFGQGRHGFGVAMRRPWCDGQEHLLQIRFKGSGAILDSASKRLKLALPVDSKADALVDGKVEIFKDGKLRGWALSRDNSNVPSELEIQIDRVKYLQVRAANRREDLARLGLSERFGGFAVDLPASPTGDSTIEISVLSLPDRAHVRGSPMKISGLVSYKQDFAAIGQAILNARQRQVSIIVPVFNAVKEVQKCFESICLHTGRSVRLIVVDDASTDGALDPLYRQYAKIPGIEIHRNPVNLGFTRTVNKGIALAGLDDVVLLNSDAVVTPRWLENLRICAYSGSKVGTVTALSDNAGAFSVPEIAEGSKLPSWLGADAYARAITHASNCSWPPVPTGNGFCMYIRRDCLEAVGPLDEQAFPRGYGEENDFCMRALRAGWSNRVDDRTIVFHVRSASFGAEKTALMEAGRQIIAERYPEYRLLTKTFRDGADFLSIRYRARRLWEAEIKSEQCLPRALYVVSTLTGGTPQTNFDLMKGVREHYDTWLLHCDRNAITLSRVTDRASEQMRVHKLRRPIEFVTHRSEEYDGVVAGWFMEFGFELLHIRHIAWHSLGLIDVANRLNVPSVFSFHDFYTVCPSIKLLDESDGYCGGKCTASSGQCENPLWPAEETPPLKHHWINRWKEMLGTVIERCDAFVTTSDSARSVIVDCYRQLAERDFHVVPHGRSFREMRLLGEVRQMGGPIRILVPGNISRAKGSAIITSLKDIDVKGELEFHILGAADSGLSGARVIHHGTYGREDFVEKVAAIRPHFGAIFSIWPETYCHTLTELWAAGIPVLAFDFGAVAERMRRSGGGWLVPHENPESLYAEISNIASNAEAYREAERKIQQWQATEGRDGTIEAMAAEYLRIYRKAAANRLAFQSSNAPQPPAGEPNEIEVGS